MHYSHMAIWLCKAERVKGLCACHRPSDMHFSLSESLSSQSTH
jgi:hypothetical protein